MLESAVTKKGQTTLPKPVRDTLGVRAGDRVRYIVLDGEVRILPGPRTPGHPLDSEAPTTFGRFWRAGPAAASSPGTNVSSTALPDPARF